MKTKYTAIYVRRSVSDKDKGNNSLSIAAQREECIRFVGEGADFKVYCDDGKSGKDVRHRPEFIQKPCRRIAEKAHCGADTYLPPHECGKVGEIL